MHRAHRVALPGGRTSWTVVDDAGLPVDAADRFLAYLDSIEHAPTTQRAYAYDLAFYFRFLAETGRRWEKVGVADLADYIFWLRRPAPNVVPLMESSACRAPTTVNRKLSAVSSFYEYHARNGVEVASQLVAWRNIASRKWKPFLHHVSKGQPVRTSPVRLKTVQRIPKTLTVEQVQAVLDACDRLRDRLLLATLYETGMRIGQALGLRHEDLRTWDKTVVIVPRADNTNGARAKTRREHALAVTVGLCRLYSDYMHQEYGDLDSDYVFVNLWSGRIGAPLSYSTVSALVDRIRTRTGVRFNLHQFRHTNATEMLRAKVRIEVVSKRLTHGSVQTTAAFYDHLNSEDLRGDMEQYWDQRAAR